MGLVTIRSNVTNNTLSHVTKGIPNQNILIAIIVVAMLIAIIVLLIFLFKERRNGKQKDIIKIINGMLNFDMLFNAVPEKSYLNFSNQIRIQIVKHSQDVIKNENKEDIKVDIFKVKIPIKKFKTYYAFVFLNSEFVKKVDDDYIAIIDNIGFKAIGNLMIQNDIVSDTDNYIKNIYVYRHDFLTILNEYENANKSRAVVSDIDTAKTIKIDAEHLKLFVDLLNSKNFKNINSMINK